MKVQIEEGATKESLIDLFVVFPNGKLVVEDGKAYWDFDKMNITQINSEQKTGQKNPSGGTFDKMGSYLNDVFSMN